MWFARFLLPHGHDDILSILCDLRGVYHAGLPRLMAVSALANALQDAADLPPIMSVVLDMFEARVADLANLDMSPDSDDYALLRLHAHLRYSNTTSDQVLAILRDPNTNSTDGLDRFAIDVFRRSLNETVAHLANLCDRSMRFCPAGLSVLEAMGRVEYRDWVTLDVFEDIVRAATKYSMLLPGNIFDLFADHLSLDGVDAVHASIPRPGSAGPPRLCWVHLGAPRYRDRRPTC